MEKWPKVGANLYMLKKTSLWRFFFFKAKNSELFVV